MQRIAITGGVAEGKTTVLRMFEALGATTLSSDALAATLLHPGTELWERLVGEFGEAILNADGTVAREQLAALAFGEVRLRRRLNQLMHPPIVEALQARLQTLQSRLVFVEVPLLIEVALQGAFDAVLVVYATPALQRQRLLARGISAERARQILQAQLPTRCKLAFADWIVRTHRPLPQVEQRVRAIWHELSR
ncbi:MAG: dephospho-CoA kinase [Armatimonadota bacterium]|nr:dephospho-CoA kinase [Armatimonadota bacterium]MDW8107828.1 dephospho-CoA kinase [Armatimonadota bacterium]